MGVSGLNVHAAIAGDELSVFEEIVNLLVSSEVSALDEHVFASQLTDG